jgi:uncharacterized protein (DUF2147 family)
MYRKLILTAAVAMSFAVPAFAATTYYVGKDAKTHKCEVTTTKPDGAAVVMIGTATYTTKAAAETALKASADCKA